MSSNIIKWLGFERAIDISSVSDGNNISQRDVIDTVISKRIGINSIYFNKDHYSNNHYPAVFIKRVDCFDTKTLKSIAETHRRVWNSKMVSFLYVHNETEIRIYNCIERPIWETEETVYEKELKGLELASAQQSDEEKLEKLSNVFSSIAIDSGIIWTLEEAAEIRKKIDINKRIDRYLVKSLVELAEDLYKDGLKDYDTIHNIILRSLFLLYLEDRGATDKEFYHSINKGDEKYFDIMGDVDNTYVLFKKLEESFNGNVFTVKDNEKADVTTEHLSKIRKCFISGYENTAQLELFTDWRLFQFDIISIELLSEIYENFLAAIDPERKKISGAFYTPPSLVELMLDETLPVNSTNLDYNFKVLDPACGSGIFLVESYKRLVRRYEIQSGEKLTDYKTLKSILLENIYGIDIDQMSVKIAAFSLYLALLDNLEPKTLWQKKRLPYLINDPDNKPDQQGKNIFVRDAIEKNEEIEAFEFDLVVGNPPFGVKGLNQTIKDYCSEYDFAKQMVIPFLHKAVQFSPKGKIAMIFNTKLLTNTEYNYPNFREWLFNESYVEKIYNFSILRNVPKGFSGPLFNAASCPVSVIFYQKEIPETPSERIPYYAPKAFIKSNVLEGIALDKSDVKYLPRKDCKNPDSSIWKIALWGGMEDWYFLKNMTQKYISLSEFCRKNDIYYGVGLELSESGRKNDEEITRLPHHNSNTIKTFFVSPDCAVTIGNKGLRRTGMVKAYNAPHILVNEGIKKQNIIACYLDYHCSYYKGVVGMYSESKGNEILKLVTCFLNSTFAKYYAFLTTSTWGIERDTVRHQELFNIPYIFSNIKQDDSEVLIDCYDHIINNNDNCLELDFLPLMKKIDDIVFNELSDRERIIVDDMHNSLNLYYEKDKSVMLKPVSTNHTSEYAITLCDELNEFLEGQPLWVNYTLYEFDRYSPLSLVKLSFNDNRREPIHSRENLSEILKNISRYHYEKKAENIYFLKRLNYYDGDDIFIVRPNQLRFRTRKAAIEDASELIVEIVSKG